MLVCGNMRASSNKLSKKSLTETSDQKDQRNKKVLKKKINMKLAMKLIKKVRGALKSNVKVKSHAMKTMKKTKKTKDCCKKATDKKQK